MKNNQLTAVLLGLFFLSVAANVWVIYQYNANIRQLQHIQQNLSGVNIVQQLLNESAEYAKTHPDMQRLLQTPVSGGASATTPSATNTKPAAPAQARPQSR